MSDPTIVDTIKRFYDVARNQLSKAIQEDRHRKAYYNDSTSSGQDQTHLAYSHELRILQSHFKPLIWGAGTTLVVFATFRLSKHTGKLVQNTNSSSPYLRYQFEKLNRNRTTREQLSDLPSLPLDLLLSFLVGTSTAIFLTDDEKVKQDVGNIPLVQGKSLFSETLCAPFLEEYQKIDPALWKSKEGRNSASLQTIRTFCMNCQKRNDVLNFMSTHRADEIVDSIQDVDDDDFNIIPPPGVLPLYEKLQEERNETK